MNRPILLLGALLPACAGAPSQIPIPANVTAIEQASGTTALLIGISPVNEQVVWAAGTGGTYVRTTDGGATWTPGKVPGAEALQFRDVHALDANTAWLLSIGNADSSRIYFTRNAGATWTLQYVNQEAKAFYDCLDFWDARRGLVIGDAVDGKTMMLSTVDGGAHWEQVPASRLPAALEGEGSLAASGTCLITRPGGHAWVAAATAPATARLLHTSDHGRSWSVDTVPLTSIASVAFRDDRHGMVLGFDSTAASASTDDGGRTWVRGGAPPFAGGVYGGVYVPGARAPAVVAVGPNGLAYSRDDGMSWTLIDRNNHWSVAFASPRAGWAIGARGRITRLSGF